MHNDRMVIRISDILHTVFKHRILILIMTLAGLGIGIVLSIVSYMRGEMSKEYAVTTSIAVTSQTKNGLFTTNTNNPNSSDIQLAEKMVDSVIFVIQSDRTMDATVKKLKLVGIGPKDISKNLELTQYKQTQIIDIVLYWRNAEEGVQILNAINSVAPGILIDTLKIGGVSVVNNPTAKYRVGGSVNASMWGYLAFLGMMAGLGLSVLFLLLRPTVVNPKDVEKVLGLEVIGEIPENRKYFNKKHSLLIEDTDNLGEEVREEYASAAHILQNRLGNKPHQCIYITSTDQNEGKTNVAANLAVQFSDLEKRVLLIDFDVRNPSLGNLFLEKVDYLHSLNALYRGDADAKEAITSLTGYLDLLPAILERKEISMGDAMLTMIRELAQNYDYVLMDTAPIGRVADTLNLNRICDTALFVIQYDSTSMNAIRDALERMDKSGIATIGCIINRVKPISGDKYKYYYGEKEKKKNQNEGSAEEKAVITEKEI